MKKCPRHDVVLRRRQELTEMTIYWVCTSNEIRVQVCHYSSQGIDHASSVLSVHEACKILEKISFDFLNEMTMTDFCRPLEIPTTPQHKS